MHSKLLSILTVVSVLALLLSACGPTPVPTASPIPVCAQSRIVSLVWDTSGGGDMRFVVDKDDAGYRIRVERYQFETIDKVIALTDASADILEVADGIFAQTLDLSNYRYPPTPPSGTPTPTGSWTNITLVCSDDRGAGMNDIEWWESPLKVLYDFVDRALGLPRMR